MNSLRQFLSQHKWITPTLTLAFFVIFGAASFPIYNITREWPYTLTTSMLVTAISLYIILGITETTLFPTAKIYHIIPLNIVLVLLSLGCRYLLEFGEVSNTYNFTVSNIILHISAALVISVCAWFLVSSKKK